MEKPSAVKIAIKWTLIYFVTSVILTYTFQFLNLDVNSPVRYITFIPYLAFLFLTQKEYRDQLGGYLTFGEGFKAGFFMGLFSAVLLAIFSYLYFSVLSPEAWQQTLTGIQTKFAASGLSSDQIDMQMNMWRNYGILITVGGSLIGAPIMGAIVALIGAAIFKKERSPFDIIQEAEANNFS